MNTKSKNHYEIVDGPSRSDLFASCERNYDKNTKINIEFSIALGYTMPKKDPRSAYLLLDVADIRITGIEHEDGSGNSFNLHGYCKANLSAYVGAELRPYRFTAYFNTKTRKGCIDFIE